MTIKGTISPRSTNIVYDVVSGQVESNTSNLTTSKNVLTSSQFDTALTNGTLNLGDTPQPTPNGVVLGPLIFVPSGGAYFERELERKGVIGSPSALDGASFQSAINSFQSTSYRQAYLPPGMRINIDQPLSMDVSKMQLDLNRGALNFKDMTTQNSYAFSLTNTANTNDYETPWVPLRNGAIRRTNMTTLADLRNDSFTNNIGGILLYTLNTPGVSSLGFENLYVEGFKYGMNFSRNCYLVNLHGCKIVRNFTGIVSKNYTDGNYSNQGERMVLSQCILANNSEHMYIEGEDVWASQTSFDYPSASNTDLALVDRKQRIATIKSGTALRLSNCHVEFRDSGPNSNDTSLIYLEDSNSAFIWDGGRLYCSPGTWDNQALSNGADGYPVYTNLRTLIQVGGSGVSNLTIKNIKRVNSSLFKDRALVKLRDTSSFAPNKVDIGADDDPVTANHKSIAPVIGDASVVGGGNFGILKNPTFTSLPTIDPWYQAQAGSSTPTGATTRFASTTLNTTVASNTMTITKTSNGSTSGRMTLLVPVVQGKKIGLKFTANASIATSAVSVGLIYCTLIPNSTSYSLNPTVNGFKTVGSGTLSLTTSDQTFDLHSLTAANNWDAGDRETTSTATHIQISWNMDTLDGSTTPFALNLKNVTVCWM